MTRYMMRNPAGATVEKEEETIAHVGRMESVDAHYVIAVVAFRLPRGPPCYPELARIRALQPPTTRHDRDRLR
jgi:hypothetical protein